MYVKTERLLAFGVEQVIWVTTQPKKYSWQPAPPPD